MSLRQLLQRGMLPGFQEDEVIAEVMSSVSMRGIKRFEMKVVEDLSDRTMSKVMIKATYGRRMERVSCAEAKPKPEPEPNPKPEPKS